MPNEREHERATDTATETPATPDAPATSGTAPQQRQDGEAVVAGGPVTVRRSAGLAALVGAAASAVAIAYLWRAAHTSAPLDWVLFSMMALIGGYHLAALVDARTPLLVADDLGVRIRLGHDWRGLPWEAVGHVVVHPRRGLLRDGRLVFAPRSLARALEGLDPRGRRHVALNQKLYGAPLAVPLGSATRLTGADAGTVVADLEALTRGRADVVELDPRTREVIDREALPVDEAGASPLGPGTRGADVEAEADALPGHELAQEPGTAPDQEASADLVTGPGDRTAVRSDEVGGARTADPAEAAGGADGITAGDADQPPTVEESDGRRDSEVGTRPRRSILGGLGTIVSRVAKGRAHDVDGPPTTGEREEPESASAGPGLPLGPAAALRETRPASRAEATITLPTAGGTALDPATGAATAPLPEGRELRRPGSVDLVIEPVPLDNRVRPISTLGDPVEPLVIDDFVTEPAYDPVIGPELTAARTRLGLSVDDLAERTRIRPHVIESIEVDDFAPCGGDFYARGHLRTLARILGKDPEPLLATFEQRYATAPINARRVFEAELATGMTGSMRATVGGPNWSLLVGVVLSLVLVWGVVRLFTADPVEMVEMPAPVLNGSAGVAGGYPVDPAPQAVAAAPVTVLLTAAQADTDVVVRDGDGMVVFSGELVLGERKSLRIAPPVRIRAADGGAVTVRVDGRDRGVLGAVGEPARRTYR